MEAPEPEQSRWPDFASSSWLSPSLFCVFPFLLLFFAVFIFQPVFKVLFCIKRDKRENQSLILCEGYEEAGWPAWVPRKLQTIMGRNLPPSPPLHLFLITWSGTRWSTDKSNYFAIPSYVKAHSFFHSGGVLILTLSIHPCNRRVNSDTHPPHRTPKVCNTGPGVCNFHYTS